MKKLILILLVLLVCTFQTATAYEYFTIHFSDGTKSEAFYATDVDSICYSKLSLDSISYDDWQVQEIYTCDSVYRYPLAKIDSLSFKDVDVDKVAEDIANVSQSIMPIFAESSSPVRLSEYLPIIQAINGVEDAYISKQSLYVKIRDWGYLSFYNPVEDSYIDLGLDLASLSRETADDKARINKKVEHKHTKAINVCIANQQHKDENRKIIIETAEWMCKLFKNMGITPHYEEMPMPSFFQNEMFDYDLIFIKTHGDYDAMNNLIWMCTGEEISTRDPKFGLTDDLLRKLINEIKLRMKHPNHSPRKMSFSWIPERRNGDSIHVLYTKISDEYIKSSNRRFRNDGSAIVFNTACESMASSKMAKAFEDRGAGCYLGYSDIDRRGLSGGACFFSLMLTGKTTQGALSAMPDWCKKDTFYFGEDGKIYDAKPSGKESRKCTPKLKLSPLTSSLCIFHPETLSYKDMTSEDDITALLEGRMRMYMFDNPLNCTRFGFEVSSNPNMDGAQLFSFSISDMPYASSMYYDQNSRYLYYDYIVESSLPQFYYRAYMNDGFSDCYGEIKQFTTKGGNEEAYAVLKDSVLTFYYDAEQKQKEGKIYILQQDYSSPPIWSGECTKVIFDPSFANYQPTSTAHWFRGCSSLKTIENIQYLNTANDSTMERMFQGCKSLTSIDLSNFNTANVTDMSCMFYNCNSLTSLDLSNFNTANVTDMHNMFGYCSSLTSLDLCSFNTANVTNMGSMFWHCSSLTNLDLSSFNTANVTDMGDMFGSCSSLTSLDLSSFNTANVTSMSYMFSGCTSTSLDLSSFNTANVTDMSYMFSGCTSTSLDLSSFNTANVTDMSGMFHECTSTSLDLSSFNTANVTKMAGMFDGCTSTSLNLSSFDTANVTDMTIMFARCSSLVNLDLSSFNTANVTSMRYMFNDCSSLTNLDLSNFNTTNVTNMGVMFTDCSSLTSLNLSSFNTANVTDMEQMFAGCSSLTSLDLSSFNTANVTDMSSIFACCSSLTILDFRNLNTANMTYMSGMFSGCSSLTDLNYSNLVLTGDKGRSLFRDIKTNLQHINLSNANTEKATDMSSMFAGCSSLTSLDLSSFNTANVTSMSYMFSGCSSLTNLDFRNLNTVNVTNMERMFYDCNSLTDLDYSNLVLTGEISKKLFRYLKNLKHIDLSNANTENATSLADMFRGCSALTDLDLSSFNTANVANMGGMFTDCSSLTSLDFRNLVLTGEIGAGLFSNLNNLTHINLSNANTEKATSMSGMFRGCSSLKSLNLSSFNTANVTDMGDMFGCCSSLTSLDLSSFNTANVTDMSGMFAGCTSTSLDLSSFNTSKVTYMSSMFSGCSSLTNLNLSSFNTANVTNMSNMFSGCSSLKSLNLISFNTANVKDMERMFSGCNSLKTIYAGNWKVNDSDDRGMFYNCNNLVGGKGTKIGKNLYGYDENGNPLYYSCSDAGSAAHIDGGKNNPGLFTAK